MASLGREAGGIMLAINGGVRQLYIEGITNMRFGKYRLFSEVVYELDFKYLVALLNACQSAKEAGEVVATMCQNEPSLNSDLVAKESFIRLLLPFLTKMKSGKGTANLRVYINDAWAARKKAMKQSGR